MIVYDIKNNGVFYTLIADKNQKQVGQRVLKLGNIKNTELVNFKLVYSTRNSENEAQLSVNEVHFYDDLDNP